MKGDNEEDVFDGLFSTTEDAKEGYFEQGPIHRWAYAGHFNKFKHLSGAGSTLQVYALKFSNGVVVPLEHPVEPLNLGYALTRANDSKTVNAAFLSHELLMSSPNITTISVDRIVQAISTLEAVIQSIMGDFGTTLVRTVIDSGAESVEDIIVRSRQLLDAGLAADIIPILTLHNEPKELNAAFERYLADKTTRHDEQCIDIESYQ